MKGLSHQSGNEKSMFSRVKKIFFNERKKQVGGN
jgi:hypothetical protein